MKNLENWRQKVGKLVHPGTWECVFRHSCASHPLNSGYGRHVTKRMWSRDPARQHLARADWSRDSRSACHAWRKETKPPLARDPSCTTVLVPWGWTVTRYSFRVLSCYRISHQGTLFVIWTCCCLSFRFYNHKISISENLLR